MLIENIMVGINFQGTLEKLLGAVTILIWVVVTEVKTIKLYM